MPDAFDVAEGTTLVESLFVSAIIIYARATVTKPIGRWLWWSGNGLDDDLRDTHNLVTKLRDKEYAHFGLGLKVHDEPMMHETLVLETNNPSPVNFRSAAWAARPELVLRFVNLASVVHGLAAEKSQAQFVAVFKELKRVQSYDGSLNEILRQHPVENSHLKAVAEDQPTEDGPYGMKMWSKVNSRSIEGA